MGVRRDRECARALRRRCRLLAYAGLLAAALLLPRLPLAAQPAYDAAELAVWHRLTADVVARAQAALDGPDAGLLSGTAVTLDERLLPGAHAVRDPGGGRRSILLFSGLAAGIDATIKIQIAGRRFGDCRKRHGDHFARFVVEEMRAVGPNAPLRRLPTVGSLFAADPACRAAAALLDDLPPALGADYQALVAGSLAFLILHELGHHALAHEAPRDPAQSRAQELAADDWALQRLPRVADPASAFPALLFIAQINWFEPAVEAAMSHPHGRERLLRLIDTILATGATAQRRAAFARLRVRLLASAEAPGPER